MFYIFNTVNFLFKYYLLRNLVSTLSVWVSVGLRQKGCLLMDERVCRMGLGAMVNREDIGKEESPLMMR